MSCCIYISKCERFLHSFHSVEIRKNCRKASFPTLSLMSSGVETSLSFPLMSSGVETSFIKYSSLHLEKSPSGSKRTTWEVYRTLGRVWLEILLDMYFRRLLNLYNLHVIIDRRSLTFVRDGSNCDNYYNTGSKKIMLLLFLERFLHFGRNKGKGEKTSFSFPLCRA